MPKIKMELKKLGKELSIKQKQDIQNIFEKNAEYFSANEKHHPDYMFELMKFYNDYFNEEEPFVEEDVGCEDCQSTMIKFIWISYIGL